MLPATEFSPCQCDYRRRRSTLCTKQQIAHPHTSTQEDLGRWQTLQLALGPFPPKEEQAARQPAAQRQQQCQWEPCQPLTRKRTSLVVEGSFQLVPHSFVAEFV